jgi:hypothetical protein
VADPVTVADFDICAPARGLTLDGFGSVGCAGFVLDKAPVLLFAAPVAAILSSTAPRFDFSSAEFFFFESATAFSFPSASCFFASVSFMFA